MLTLLASCLVRRAAGEYSLALVALVVGDRIGAELVSRIAEWVLVFLGTAEQLAT